MPKIFGLSAVVLSICLACLAFLPRSHREADNPLERPLQTSRVKPDQRSQVTHLGSIEDVRKEQVGILVVDERTKEPISRARIVYLSGTAEQHTDGSGHFVPARNDQWIAVLHPGYQAEFVQTSTTVRVVGLRTKPASTRVFCIDVTGEPAEGILLSAKLLWSFDLERHGIALDVPARPLEGEPGAWIVESPQCVPVSVSATGLDYEETRVEFLSGQAGEQQDEILELPLLLCAGICLEQDLKFGLRDHYRLSYIHPQGLQPTAASPRFLSGKLGLVPDLDVQWLGFVLRDPSAYFESVQVGMTCLFDESRTSIDLMPLRPSEWGDKDLIRLKSFCSSPPEIECELTFQRNETEKERDDPIGGFVIIRGGIPCLGWHSTWDESQRSRVRRLGKGKFAVTLPPGSYAVSSLGLPAMKRGLEFADVILELGSEAPSIVRREIELNRTRGAFLSIACEAINGHALDTRGIRMTILDEESRRPMNVPNTEAGFGIWLLPASVYSLAAYLPGYDPAYFFDIELEDGMDRELALVLERNPSPADWETVVRRLLFR